MWWKQFWDGLNIRKAIVLALLFLYGQYIITTRQDMGIKDMALLAISYYFGYSNGQTADGAKKK